MSDLKYDMGSIIISNKWFWSNNEEHARLLAKKLIQSLNLVQLDPNPELPENPYNDALIPLPERIWRTMAFQEGVEKMRKEGFRRIKE